MATVLVVHDTPAISMALARLLMQEGFEVRTAARGAEALALLDTAPDAVVLDTDLTDIGGFELCRRLKANAATRETPVLMLSATCRTHEDRERAVASGADVYLLEPVAPQELVAAVQRLVRLRHAEAGARAATAALDFARAIAASPDAEAAPAVITQRASGLVAAERCAVLLLDGGRGSVAVATFANGQPAPDLAAQLAQLERDTVDALPIVARALRSGEPAMVDGVTASPEVPAEWTAWYGARALLVVPLVHGSEPIGALVFDAPAAPGAWRAEQVALATALATQATLAIENARLLRQARGRSEQLRLLGEQSEELARVSDPVEVFHAVARVTTTVLGAKITHVWLDAPAARVLRVRGSFAVDRRLEQLSMAFFAVPHGAGIVGQVFTSRTPAYVPDVQRDARWLNRDFAVEAGAHGYAGLPLVVAGRCVGALSILFGEPREFTRDERDMVELIAQQAALAIRRAQPGQPSAVA